MKRQLSLLLAGALALGILPAAQADWTYGGYLETLSLDSEVAAREGVDDKALALGFGADHYSHQLLMVSLGMAFVQYDDKRGFDQTVEVVGGFDDGDVRTEDSDATAFLFYLDMGPRFTFGENHSSYFAPKVGFTTFMMSERSIGNCRNCYEEDIDIDGGLYFQAALAHSFGSLSMGIAFNKYLDSDKGLDSGFRILISSGF